MYSPDLAPGNLTIIVFVASLTLIMYSCLLRVASVGLRRVAVKLSASRV